MCDEHHSLFILSIISWIKCINSFGDDSRSVNLRPFINGRCGPHNPPSTILVISPALPLRSLTQVPPNLLCGSNHWLNQRHLCSPGAGPGPAVRGRPKALLGVRHRLERLRALPARQRVMLTFHSWACFFVSAPSSAWLPGALCKHCPCSKWLKTLGLTFSAAETLQGTNYLLSGRIHCTKKSDGSTACLQTSIVLQMVRKQGSIRLSSDAPKRQPVKDSIVHLHTRLCPAPHPGKRRQTYGSTHLTLIPHTFTYCMSTGHQALS